MSKFTEKAYRYRNDPAVHYNCAQSVLLAFDEDLGVDKGPMKAVSANFGAGMKRGSVCGAITGGLMVLGLMGIEDDRIAQYHRKLMESHGGCLNCAELLAKNKELGGDKKAHCDEMVYECVRLCEELRARQ